MDAEKRGHGHDVETEAEIEVTPEMIRVGVRELELSVSSDGVPDPSEDVCRDVFLAMWRERTRR